MSFAVTSQVPDLMDLTKILFPEFNCNIVINERHVLIFDSDILHDNITFDVNFVDKSCF